MSNKPTLTSHVLDVKEDIGNLTAQVAALVEARADTDKNVAANTAAIQDLRRMWPILILIVVGVAWLIAQQAGLDLTQTVATSAISGLIGLAVNKLKLG